MAGVSKPIVLHRGSGRNAAVESLLSESGWTIVAYVDVGDTRAPALTGAPVVGYDTWRTELQTLPSLVIALDSELRHDLVERLLADGGHLARLAPSGSAISPDARFGDGTIVGEGTSFIGTQTTIGRFTIVMTPTSIGHHTDIGDYVTIYPSAAISGHVVIEDFVRVGVGAVVVNGRADKPLRIGRGATLAPGAVITTSVRAGATVAGNPARSK